MRHRIKKIPNLSTLFRHFGGEHKLLHSDKSTYTCFYKSKLVGNNKGIHKSYPGLWFQTIPLGLFAFAFLLVLGILVFPSQNAEVYAADNQDVEVSSGDTENLSSTCDEENATIALNMSGDMSLGKEVDNDIKAGQVSYLQKDFSITGCQKAEYKIYVQANSSQLQNQQAPDALFGVGENVAPNKFANNTWGYAIDRQSVHNADLKYNTMPEVSATKKASYSDNVLPNATDNLKIVFAAKFDSSKAAGHYSTDVLMSVVSTPAQTTNLYSITYDANGGTGSPDKQEVNLTDETFNYTFTIPKDVIPTRAGYSFRGWGTYYSNTTASYVPGQEIRLSATKPDRQLYAIWVPVVNEFNVITDMQQMTNELCTRTTTPSIWDTVDVVPTAQLTDIRDGKKYWIAKLADGNCWMTQNLDYDIKATGISGVELEQTDLTTAWIPSSSYPPVATETTLTKWKFGSGYVVASYDPGLKYCSNNTTDQCNLTTSANGGHDAIGNYYSWNAAVAGTASATTTSSTGSICPKGWQLPKADFRATDSKTFRYLTNSYGITSGTSNGKDDSVLLAAPLYFIRSGEIFNSEESIFQYNQGYQGYYLSSIRSTIFDNGILSSSYGLSFGRPNHDSENIIIYPDTMINTYYGNSIRCVAR